MPAISLILGQEAVLSSIGAQDDSGNPQPAAFSAQIAPYSAAYVANAGGTLHVVAKTTGSATLTISGHSQDGTALPPQAQDFTITTPPPPQATQFVLGSWTVKSKDIWCAKTKAKVWRNWMIDGEAPISAAAGCDVAALERNLKLGQRYKVQGTPAVVFEDGSRTPGAMPAAQIEARMVAAAKKS